MGVAGIAGIGALWLLDRTLLRQDLAWVLLGGAAFARELADPLPAVELGGIAVNTEDVIFALAMMVVLGWLLRGVALQAPQVLIALALVLVLFSILRGTPFFGFPAAVNEARETLYFIGAALLGSFAAVDAAARRRLMRGWLLLSSMLCALTVLRWLIVLTGLPFRGFWYESEFGGLRVLASNGGVVIAVGFVMLLPRVLTGRALDSERLLAGGFAVVVLLLQHRSVWAVLCIGTALMVWEHRGQIDRRLVAGVGMVCVLLGVLAVTVLDTGDIARQASTADAASDRTWQWRVSGWTDLLETSGPAGPLEMAFGAPYGAGWERSVSAGFDVDVPPHNFYLEMLLRIGIVGLGLVVTAGVQSYRRLRAHDPDGDDGFLDAATLLTILMIQALYSVPYNLGMEQGLLFGLAIAVWADPLRRRGRGVVIMNRPIQPNRVPST